MSSSGYEGCGICKNADSVSFCKQILIEYVLEKSEWLIRGLYSPPMVCAALPRARVRDSPSDRFAELLRVESDQIRSKRFVIQWDQLQATSTTKKNDEVR